LSGNDFLQIIGNLSELSMTRNSLESLSNDTFLGGDGLKVKILDLSQNKLQYFVGGGRLRGLKLLDLSSNLLQQVYELGAIERLESVNLRDNRISYLQPATFQVSHKSSLDFLLVLLKLMPFIYDSKPLHERRFCLVANVIKTFLSTFSQLSFPSFLPHPHLRKNLTQCQKSTSTPVPHTTIVRGTYTRSLRMRGQLSSAIFYLDRKYI
jgi:hypothetical protein